MVGDSDVEEVALSNSFFGLIYSKLNPLTEASRSLVTLGPKSAMAALGPVTPQRCNIPFFIVASLPIRIWQAISSTSFCAPSTRN